MARIVFACELGSSGERLRRSIAIAGRLQAEGHDVSFVVADLIAADTLLTPKGMAFVAAPLFAKRSLRSHRPASRWKNLAAPGADDRESLPAHIRAWVKLFDSFAADAIVIDGAPTARLAARLSQRRTLLLDRDLTQRGCLRDLPMQLHGEPLKPKDRRRVLYAWELGTNAGHLERGVAIAEELRGRGHEVVFVVRDLVLAERLLAARGFDFMPAPSTALLSPPRPTVNFSDLLLTCGFDDAVALAARVRAWTHLLRHLEPDSIVIDHAPTAQLAAYIANLPSILVNSGFSIPPLAQPFPSIQPRVRVSTQQLSLADRRALTTVNEVAREFGARPLSHLGELFARSTQILTTFKELDPYPGRASGMHVGPVERATVYANTQWRTVGRVRVFAYLRPVIKALDMLLQTLHACNAEVICVLPGASALTVKHYQAAHFAIFTEPIELDSLLKEADVVISYGSGGLLARALLAGVPLLLMPDALEQIINSVRVAELGAGIVLFEERDPATIMAALTTLTTQTRYRTAARNFAAKYQDRAPDAGKRIVDAIEQSF